MYAALDRAAAIIECVSGGAELDMRAVGQTFLRQRSLWNLAYNEGFEVADLNHPHAARFGVTGELSNGANYRTSQKWAQAFHELGL